jgi:hypothetical protein
MRQDTLIKTYAADGVIAAFRIVVCGNTDDRASQATAATEMLMGISGELAVSNDERIDIVKAGIAAVEYGGFVLAGNWLTTDADGKAVAASVGDNVIGFAEMDGVSGDIGAVYILPGKVHVAGHVALVLPAISLVGTGVACVVSPVAGTIETIQSVIDGALTTGNATLTGKIIHAGSSANITDGVITITQAGSAANDVDSVSPSALNDVAKGDVISITVGGTNDAARTATVTIDIAT